MRRKWNITKRDAPAECDVTILQRACLKRGSSGAKVENSNSSLSLLSWNVGSMARHSKANFELLISESPRPFSAGGPHHTARAQGDEASLSGSGVFCALGCIACIARHGLYLCQTRGPECVEWYRLGYCALQLRDTRVLLRNVHYPSEGPSERAKLEQDLEGVDIARCFSDFGKFISQPAWRTGDHVLMPKCKDFGETTLALPRLFVVSMVLVCQTASVGWRQSRHLSQCWECNTGP